MSGTGLGAVLLIVVFCWPVKAQDAGLVKDGDSAFAKGDYDAARRSFEKALETSADSPARYEILKRLTSASAASGQFADAQRYLQQAMTGLDDPKLDDLLLSVNLDLRTKQFDHALSTAQRVQATHVATYTPESLPVADDLLRIGQIYLAEKKPNEAARSLIAALEIRTKLVGSLDPGLLPVLDQLIEAFRAIPDVGGNGVCPGCETIYRQALIIRETVYGENSSELISTIEGLADVYSGEGMLSAAEPVYLRLLALWESAVGRDHPMVAVTLDKLVVFYAKAGEPQKAREALARSVAIRAHFLAVGLSLQAQDAVSENQRERAKVLYNRALAALGPRGSANEELIAEIRRVLGTLGAASSKTPSR
jgi:tetratricopeptide (TPR) repeat protein